MKLDRLVVANQLADSEINRYDPVGLICTYLAYAMDDLFDRRLNDILVDDLPGEVRSTLGNVRQIEIHDLGIRRLAVFGSAIVQLKCTSKRFVQDEHRIDKLHRGNGITAETESSQMQ